MFYQLIYRYRSRREKRRTASPRGNQVRGKRAAKCGWYKEGTRHLMHYFWGGKIAVGSGTDNSSYASLGTGNVFVDISSKNWNLANMTVVIGTRDVVSVSISWKVVRSRSRSRLGLGPQRLVYIPDWHIWFFRCLRVIECQVRIIHLHKAEI